MKEDQSVVVIAGPPGAGKTSVAKALVDRIDQAVLVDGDAFFDSSRENWIPPWTPEADEQNATVIRTIGAAAKQFATGGCVVVVDAVIGPWFLGKFLEEVESPVCYVILRPSAEITMKRAIGRDGSELVDPEPVLHMINEFSELGDHERFVIDSTDLSLDETTEYVLKLIFENPATEAGSWT